MRANTKKKKGQPEFRIPRPEREVRPKESVRSRMKNLARQLKGGW